ncbi:4Fe-4S binding protein [candidate division TA06 bacterium]|uniref:4Fe-4S binding protein n=1 Tax=candidate division TA06 bacterium TaxID=2250710 RepID=A0A933I963_UNCT6|nr:4Fe-4S binding protein [candidate division TA06 bacterium]
MPFVIGDECIACGSCVDSCPNGAIVEGEDKFEITEDCVDCGACVDACPVNAIKET